MIINLPAAAALNATALKLYFRAWQGIVAILHDFDGSFAGEAQDWVKAGKDSWAVERAEYLEWSQEELQAILAIVQQSNEIALKARIVAVSPYLLLLNSDIGFKNHDSDIEFATLRTLDAVELPKAVNALTGTPVSETFIQRYGELRTIRNQYAHLGNTNIELNPVLMCARMIDQYWELWRDRAWLRDRVEFTHGRQGYFDGKHWSPLQDILHGLDYDRALIPAAPFKKLFGVKKSAVSFGCHQCQDDWAVSRNGPGPVEAPTAYYDNVKSKMHCVVCDEDFETKAGSKACDDCGCAFIAPDSAEYGAGKCFSCGE